MVTLLFILLMIAVYGSLITLAFKMAWGLAKLLLIFIALPIVLIGLVIMGLVVISMPILAMIGLLSVIFWIFE